MSKNNDTTQTIIYFTKETKEKAKKASKKMFGRVNVSGYVAALVNEDCDKKGINND